METLCRTVELRGCGAVTTPVSTARTVIRARLIATRLSGTVKWISSGVYLGHRGLTPLASLGLGRPTSSPPAAEGHLHWRSTLGRSKAKTRIATMEHRRS